MPERDPAINPVCVHCGADAIIPDVYIVASGYGTIKTQVGLSRNPESTFRKRSVTVDATAQVCGECGAVTLVASDPDTLWLAHLERLANES
ncbi:MAG: hypothetical protein AAF791_04230 [Bacteroidota bacterium]